LLKRAKQMQRQARSDSSANLSFANNHELP